MTDNFSKNDQFQLYQIVRGWLFERNPGYVHLLPPHNQRLWERALARNDQNIIPVQYRDISHIQILPNRKRDQTEWVEVYCFCEPKSRGVYENPIFSNQINTLIRHCCGLTFPTAGQINSTFKHWIDFPTAQICEDLMSGQLCPENITHVKAWADRCYNRPYTEPGERNWSYAVLLALNELLGGHGVEAIYSENCGSDGSVAFEYVNMGEAYASTIVWDCENEWFTVSSWGDVVETPGGFYDKWSLEEKRDEIEEKKDELEKVLSRFIDEFDDLKQEVSDFNERGADVDPESKPMDLINLYELIEELKEK